MNQKSGTLLPLNANSVEGLTERNEERLMMLEALRDDVTVKLEKARGVPQRNVHLYHPTRAQKFSFAFDGQTSPPTIRRCMSDVESGIWLPGPRVRRCALQLRNPEVCIMGIYLRGLQKAANE